MGSGLAFERRISSKLCGPVGWPKMFINSDIGFSRYGIRLQQKSRRGSSRASRRLLQVHVEAERAQFLHQEVEGLRNAGLEVVVALDDRLVDLGAARDVVRFNRQDHMHGVGGAGGFQSPELPPDQAMTPESCIAPH